MYYDDEGIKYMILKKIVLHKKRLEASMPHPINI